MRKSPPTRDGSISCGVVERITRKMIERHPHVFGSAVAHTAADVSQHWDAAKNKEKPRDSLLDGIPLALPQLARAAKLSKKAARVGYDFPDRAMLFDKLREELAELASELFPDGIIPQVSARVETAARPRCADRLIPPQRARVEDELGDLLFVVANIARRWKIDPEEALRRSNAKFERRFRYIEQQLAAQNRTLADATLDRNGRALSAGQTAGERHESVGVRGLLRSRGRTQFAPFKPTSLLPHPEKEIAVADVGNADDQHPHPAVGPVHDARRNVDDRALAEPRARRRRATPSPRLQARSTARSQSRGNAAVPRRCRPRVPRPRRPCPAG